MEGSEVGLFKFHSMKRILYSIAGMLLALLAVSCGTDGRHFEIDGRLLNMNQGEFYVYSPDGEMNGIDTIRLEAGRFTYSVECDKPMTLMLVFPNFTEQPIFAQPGKSVDLKGDASHLKELTVKGTKDNELMNAFRERIVSASPDEARRYAVQMAGDNPGSRVAVYLVARYLVAADKPDPAEAKRLLTKIAERQPDNIYARRMLTGLSESSGAGVGSAVPVFTATDTEGRPVSNATLTATPRAVVVSWASWNYNSISFVRRMLSLRDDSNGRLTVVGVSLDPSPARSRQLVKQNSFGSLVNVCDGKMASGPLWRQLGLSFLPDNILIENGKITARSLSLDEMERRLKD